MKRFGSLCVIGVILCAILLGTVTAVRAAEADTDFEDEGWFARMEEAELDVLFATSCVSDGAYSEFLTFILGDRFFEDPLAFIRALAQEEEAVRDNIMERFARSMYHEMHPDGYEKFPSVIQSLELTDADSAAAHEILDSFKDDVAEYWGIEIPKTADPVGVFAALLALSAAGAGVMLARKKEGWL